MNDRDFEALVLGGAAGAAGGIMLWVGILWCNGLLSDWTRIFGF